MQFDNLNSKRKQYLNASQKNYRLNQYLRASGLSKNVLSPSEQAAKHHNYTGSAMSDLDQNDHQVWMNPVDNMYADNNHHQPHSHHEQHLEHNQMQNHVQPQDNAGGNNNRNHYYTLHGSMEHGQLEHHQAQGHSTNVSTEMNPDHQGYSGTNIIHQNQPNSNINDNIASKSSSKTITKGEKQIERAERKRKRERQRREDVNRLFDDLNAILAKIEKEQHELLEKQEQESQNQDDDKMKKKLKWIRRNQIQLGKNASTSTLNRAEVIARAVAVLEELSEERKDQRNEIEQLKEELSNASKSGLSVQQTPLQLHLPNAGQSGMNQPLNAVMSSLATQHTHTQNPAPAPGNSQTDADQQQVVMMVPMMVPAPGQNAGTTNQSQRAVFFPQFSNAATMQPQAQMQSVPTWNSHNPAQANVPIAFNAPQQIQQPVPTYTAPTPAAMQQIQPMAAQIQQQHAQKHQPGPQDQQQHQQAHIQQGQHDKNHTQLNVSNMDGPKSNNVNSNEGNLAHCA